MIMLEKKRKSRVSLRQGFGKRSEFDRFLCRSEGPLYFYVPFHFRENGVWLFIGPLLEVALPL